MSETTNDESLQKVEIPQEVFSAAERISTSIREFKPDLIFFLGRSSDLSKTLLIRADPKILDDFDNITFEGQINRILTGVPIGAGEKDRTKQVSDFLQELERTIPEVYKSIVNGGKKIVVVDDYISGGTKMTNSISTIEETKNIPKFLALSYITEGAGFDEAYRVSTSTFQDKVVVGTQDVQAHNFIVSAARLISDSKKGDNPLHKENATALLDRVRNQTI